MCLKADKIGEYMNKDFKDNCPQTGVSLEYASINVPHQISMPKPMVRYMCADNGLLKFSG